jgi:hypothetical protein
MMGCSALTSIPSTCVDSTATRAVNCTGESNRKSSSIAPRRALGPLAAWRAGPGASLGRTAHCRSGWLSSRARRGKGTSYSRRSRRPSGASHPPPRRADRRATRGPASVAARPSALSCTRPTRASPPRQQQSAPPSKRDRASARSPRPTPGSARDRPQAHQGARGWEFAGSQLYREQTGKGVSALTRPDRCVSFQPLIAGPPPHHAVDRRNRPFLHDTGQKGSVRGVELGRHAWRRNVEETVRPLPIEPDHPVPQRLTIHAADLGRLCARGSIEHRRDRQ